MDTSGALQQILTFLGAAEVLDQMIIGTVSFEVPHHHVPKNYSSLLITVPAIVNFNESRILVHRPEEDPRSANNAVLTIRSKYFSRPFSPSYAAQLFY